MVGENGYELIRKIRSLRPEAGGHIPAIALTAYAGTADRRRALLAGFQTHLSKPVEPDDLLAVILSLTFQQETSASSKR
jgi:CheY-like chemotaxis protein